MPVQGKPLTYPYNTHNFNPPAPVLEVSLVRPDPSSSGHTFVCPALLDTGADITAIPKRATQQLQLRYVDETDVSGYEGILRRVPVFSVRVVFINLGDYVIRCVETEDDFVLLGRDILNRWDLFLRGRSGEFNIS